MMFDIRKNVIASVAAIGSIAILLTACTDYYEQFSNEYAFGKAKDRFVFDGQTLTDLRNDQTYEVVKVGNLYWMNRNLGFQFYHSHFDDTKTSCHRPSEETCEQIGFLYPGTRLDDLCLDGWRLPSAEEWEEYYNSSAFTVTYGKDSYRGYESGDGSLNEDGKSAYFWTNDNTGNDAYRKCISFTPESNSFFSGANCHEQWKMTVRCVKEVNGGSSQSGDSGNDEPVDYHYLLDQYNCSVSDGVKVLYPEGGESFKVGETIPVIYGSDVKGSGYRFVFKTSEDDAGVDLLEEFAGEENPNGQSCYVQEVKLSAGLVGGRGTTKGFIRVIPYENTEKGANSGPFSVGDTRGETDVGEPAVIASETNSSPSQEDSVTVYDVSSSSSTPSTSSSSTPNTSSSSTPNTSSSATPKSSSSVKSKICGDLWCGWTDTEGRVMTESEDGTAGWWYDCNDNQKGQYGPQIVCEDGYATRGSSVFQYPYGVEVNPYGNFYGPLIEAYQGIKGKVVLGEGYQYPFIFLAFNLVSENKEGMDISGWDGFCLVYESDLSFSLEVVPENESTVTEYNNYKASVPKSSYITWDVPWNKFKQGDGWGKEVDQATVLSDAATIRLKFEGTPGTTGEFNIHSIGRLGSCGPIN